MSPKGWEDKHWHSGHLRQLGPEGQNPQREKKAKRSQSKTSVA